MSAIRGAARRSSPVLVSCFVSSSVVGLHLLGRPAHRTGSGGSVSFLFVLLVGSAVFLCSVLSARAARGVARFISRSSTVCS